MPQWRVGMPYHQVDNLESYLRPPPKVNHKHVVFASLKDLDPLPDMHDVVLAAYAQFGFKVVAIDVFTASLQVALAFTSAAHADTAAKEGLRLDEDLVLPCARRPNYQPIVEKAHVFGVDCTDPDAAAAALCHFFGYYGRVLEVAPRYWESTPIMTGTWHVLIDRNAAVKDKINTVPPEIARIGGVDVILDIPGVRRVCRVCKSTEHTNPACRVGQTLAQQGKQQQQKDQQQQQQQKQQQKHLGPRRWADLLKPQSTDRVPPPMPAPKKAGKGKGKAKATDTGNGNNNKDNTNNDNSTTTTTTTTTTGKDATGADQQDPPARPSPRSSPVPSRQVSPARQMDTDNPQGTSGTGTSGGWDGHSSASGTEWANDGSPVFPRPDPIQHDPIRDPANLRSAYRYDLDVSARERGDDADRRSRSPTRRSIFPPKGVQPSPDELNL
jgi:hypothetical protein